MCLSQKSLACQFSFFVFLPHFWRQKRLSSAYNSGKTLWRCLPVPGTAYTVRAIDGPLWRQERIRTRVLGKNVKNWTVRQRILASFAVIIAIMLLMAATAYVKMLTVEKGAYRVQDDAMPGMYFITLVRSSWTDNYLQTQELFGVTDDHELSKAEADSILASEERLDQQIASYQKTMNPDEARDHELLAGFLGVRKAYLEQHDKVLELYREKRFEEAGKLVAGPLTEHWRDGRKYLNELIELNKDIADRASENIVNAVDDAELSMLVTLLLAVVVAGICGFLLLRAITQPIQKIVRSLDLMAGGDLTARLNLGRRDEFGAIETGFQRHGRRAQGPGVAGPAFFGAGHHLGHRDRRDLQAAAGHRHRNRCDHHGDRRHFSRDRRHLARPGADHEQKSPVPPSRLDPWPVGPGAHGGNHAPRDGCGRPGQRQAGDPQREGRQHQPGGHHHRQGRRPDQPAR